MKIKLLIKSHFDAAHFLPGYDGDCSRIHGHRWKVEFEFVGDVSAETGMLRDFKELKCWTGSLLPDHRLINDWWPAIIPTAENIAYKLYQILEPGLHILKRVTVWETEECGASYPAE